MKKKNNYHYVLVKDGFGISNPAKDIYYVYCFKENWSATFDSYEKALQICDLDNKRKW